MIMESDNNAAISDITAGEQLYYNTFSTNC